MRNTCRIVIADDHPLVRRIVRRILESVNNFRVVGEAGDGEEAVEQVGEQHPDAAILDLAMPKLNGIEATRRIRQLPSPPEVIVLTAYQDDYFVFQAFDAGCIGYVTKESAPTDLPDAINEVVQGRFFLSRSVRHLSREIERRQGISKE
ncbi:MAG: response regulator [Chloroflexota bacterium]